jgi:hypothetical protein
MRWPKRAREAGPWRRKISANSTTRARLRRAEVGQERGEGIACHGVGFACERRVEGGRGGRVVSQRILEEAEIDPRFEQRGGIAVAQGVDRGTVGDPTLLERGSAGILHPVARPRHGGGSHPHAATAWSGQEPGGMAGGAPGLAEPGQGARWQRHRAVLGAFAVPHVHEHAGPGDSRHLEMGALLEPEAPRVEGGQAGPRAQEGEVLQTSPPFFDTEENRERLFPGRADKGQGGPLAPEGMLVDALNAAEGHGAGAARVVGDIVEREEGGAEFFLRDAGGGRGVMCSALTDGPDLRLRSPFGQAAERDIRDHPLLERGHGSTSGTEG